MVNILNTVLAKVRHHS